MKKFLLLLNLILILTVSFLSASCAHQSRVVNEEKGFDDYFVIWSHSDIQYRSEDEIYQYPKAVDDVSEKFDEIDIAVFAGDIVQKSDYAEVYKWYLETGKKAPVRNWLNIAGNHEWKNIDIYKTYIDDRLNYSYEEGNLLILMMSNEKKGRITYITDETFEWWKQKVIDNQGKIIITVTHASLGGSGLAASRIERLRIVDSERFVNVLEDYNMDIWISGHSHFPGWLPRTAYNNKRLGTAFIDNGAIRKDEFTSIESRFLFFKEGDDNAVMKRRNHAKERFARRDFVIPLSNPFSLD